MWREHCFSKCHKCNSCERNCYFLAVYQSKAKKANNIVAEEPPGSKNKAIETGAELEWEYDEYSFSNRYLWRVSYRVGETEKELKLRKIENKLAEKYMSDVFLDSLEGGTIRMDPVDIIIDDSIPKQ